MADRIPTSSRAAQLSGLALAAIAAATGIIKPSEGEVLHTYPDVVLGWSRATACDGHTDPSLKPGMTFTVDECDDMLHADLRKTYDQEAACMPIARLNANQAGAILDLGYNAGAGTVCRSSIPGKVKAGQIAAACATIVEFDKSDGKDCHVASNHCLGIIHRRAVETALCERQP